MFRFVPRLSEALSRNWRVVALLTPFALLAAGFQTLLYTRLSLSSYLVFGWLALANLGALGVAIVVVRKRSLLELREATKPPEVLPPSIQVPTLGPEEAKELAETADDIERLLRQFFYSANRRVVAAGEPNTWEWRVPEGESAYLLNSLREALTAFHTRLEDDRWLERDRDTQIARKTFERLQGRLRHFSQEVPNEERRFYDLQDVINEVTGSWCNIKAILKEAFRAKGLMWPAPTLPFHLWEHFYDATTSWVPCHYYWIKPLEEATANRPLKNVLFQHPQLKAPSQVIYRIRGLPDDSSAFALRFGYGIVKAYFDPFLASQVENTSFQQEKDHIRFNIRVVGRTTKEWQGDCYYHHWILGQEVKPIEAQAGGEIEVYLTTDCCGVETGNWAAWADPVLHAC